MSKSVFFMEQSFLEIDMDVTNGHWFELSMSDHLFSQFAHEGIVALSMRLEVSPSPNHSPLGVVRVRQEGALIYEETQIVITGTEIKFNLNVSRFYESTIFHLEIQSRDAPKESGAAVRTPRDQVFNVKTIDLVGASTWINTGEININLAEVAANKLYRDVENTFYEASKLSELISASLASGTGFSLIRLGDGEGRILGYESAFNEYHILDGVLSYQYGSGSTSLMSQRNPDNWIHLAAIDLQEKLQKSIKFSSVLAIPGQNWLRPGGHFLGRYASAISVLDGIRFFQGESTQIFETYFLRDKRIFDTTVMKSFHHAKKIVQIGPTDATNYLSKTYNVDASLLAFIKTAPHATFPNGDLGELGLYPDSYKEIEREIREFGDLNGHLFLVGAGILGKWFCELVRRNGGVAIDIGSLYDTWLGTGRPEALPPTYIS
jgi:hypothetical protein